MNDYPTEAEREYAAYNAHEQAKSGIHIGTVLKNLGRYDQGVVDTAAGVGKPTIRKSRKPRKSKKSC